MDSSGSPNINIHRSWCNSWWEARESDLVEKDTIGGTSHYNEDSVELFGKIFIQAINTMTKKKCLLSMKLAMHLTGRSWF